MAHGAHLAQTISVHILRRPGFRFSPDPLLLGRVPLRADSVPSSVRALPIFRRSVGSLDTHPTSSRPDGASRQHHRLGLGFAFFRASVQIPSCTGRPLPRLAARLVAEAAYQTLLKLKPWSRVPWFRKNDERKSW